MAYTGLKDFIGDLEKIGELKRISLPVDPNLEITEIADRVFKSGGQALLFENTGTDFPVLINMYGSDIRMSMSLGREDFESAGRELEDLFRQSTGSGSKGFFSKLRMIPRLGKLAGLLPKKRRGKGLCQQIVNLNPDLDILPVLNCWPHDGGKFITLPVVHTKSPLTGEVNAGMYRMQILDKLSTGMHWHRHKTGANHYKEYKSLNQRMPVSVTLGGDPVYTYCATAPLPEGIDEYILAGFLRHKRVNMVKCITNDLYVPEDVDIVIEGYVDTSEDLVWEGPFGDHTGFYSLADWYPRFHVTAICHQKDAIYPATIVGVPPQEDAVIGLATEKLFLFPIKLAMQPDIVDFHMPTAGVAHNLVLVKIDKKFPGQGLKVINSLFGAGQMMFSKFIVVVDKDANLRDYYEMALRVLRNCSFKEDIIIQQGPLDVLDHASNSFSFGGKMGIDATVKHPEELASIDDEKVTRLSKKLNPDIKGFDSIIALNKSFLKNDIPILFLTVDKDLDWETDIKSFVSSVPGELIFLLDKNVDINDLYTCSWQILANTDPNRDLRFEGETMIFNSTSKSHPSDKFPRSWPNVVVSDNLTIEKIDSIWDSLGLGPKIESPSVKFRDMLFEGEAEVKR